MHGAIINGLCGHCRHICIDGTIWVFQISGGSRRNSVNKLELLLLAIEIIESLADDEIVMAVSFCDGAGTIGSTTVLTWLDEVLVDWTGC